MRTYDHGFEGSRGRVKRKKKGSGLDAIQRYIASLSEEQVSRMMEDSGKSYANGQDVTGRAIFESTKRHQREEVQAKLAISQPQDQSEKQADKVAEGVTKGDTSISKMALEQTPSDINTKSEDAGMTTTPGFDQQLQDTKGQGSKLDTNVKSEMEGHLGTDLAGVNVHTGGEAQKMSGDINAKAFAHGQDVYFNEGQYNPSSQEGKGLLAHELTHTVQQKGDVGRKVQRAPEKYKTGKTLQSIWFKGIPELESAFEGKLAFGNGASGLFVQRIQLAMLRLQHVMRWTDETGKKFLVNLGEKGDDDIFGEHTEKSMIAVQKKLDLKETDGVVGKETMEKLDSIFWKEKKTPESYNQMKAEAHVQEAIPKTEFFSVGRMGATLNTYKDISTTGKKIYDQPSGKEKFTIKYGEKLSVYAYFNDWYQVGYDGKLGWVQKDYVKEPLPLDDE
jgi:hypothetical protein